MEKLDKEALAKELYSIFNNEGNAYYIQVGIVKGLEYAENHYLKIIEEKDKIIDDREKWANNLITEKDFLTIELQQAKEIIRDLESEIKSLYEDMAGGDI